MQFKTQLLAVALVTLLASPALAEDDAPVYQQLIAQKADTIVNVKIVLNVKMSRMGQTQENEMNASATGIVVDSSGLIMLPQSAFEASFGAGIPRRFLRQMNIQSAPVSIRVVFPGDTKEYDAVLGAKDSKLGLAFVLIKDLGEKKITPVDMSKTMEPKVGTTLYGVTRLGEGFDHAPMCSRARIAGSVTKPRTMWIVQGVGGMIAKPLYDATGAIAGVVVQQEGVGENARERPFLLPLKVARPTVAGALKKAKDELERVLDEEAEKAEEEAEAKKAEAEAAKEEGAKEEGAKEEGAKKEEGDGKKEDGGGDK